MKLTRLTRLTRLITVVDRPLLLLDVDGVLNPWLMPRLPTDYQEHRIGQFDVVLATWHGPALVELSQHTGLELVWATTWEEDANREIAPRVGLPNDLPWIPCKTQEINPLTETRKLPAVRRWVEDRACVWIDDDLWSDAWTWAAKRTDAGIPTLLVQPNPVRGLTRQHLDAIEEWVENMDA